MIKALDFSIQASRLEFVGKHVHVILIFVQQHQSLTNTTLIF